MKINSKHPIIFFDGICNLCNSSVQFILKKDQDQKFKFASLQSDAAKEILLQFQKNNSDLDSITLFYNNKLYLKSSAILQVCNVLGGWFYLLIIFWIVPKPIRDWMYDFVAKNRYRWFGKRESCMLPSAELSDRYL